jgi:hypothetical protein
MSNCRSDESQIPSFAGANQKAHSDALTGQLSNSLAGYRHRVVEHSKIGRYLKPM